LTEIDPEDSTAQEATTVATYNEIAASYAKAHFDAQEMETHLALFASRLKPGSLIVDAGCGPGHHAKYFKTRGFEVIGLDLSDKMLEIARSLVPEGIFIKHDMREGIPDLAARAAGIWCCASLLHVPRGHALKALSALSALLTPGGSFFLSVMHGSGQEKRTSHPVYGSAVRYFTLFNENEVRELLTSAGLVVGQIKCDDRWIWTIAGRPK